MDRINDYEMNIKKTTKSTAKCELCGHSAQEMYLMRRHGESHYLCRSCMSGALLVAALMEK